MTIIKMNMNQVNIEHKDSITPEYNDEIMSSGWNPVIGLSQLVPEKKHRSIPTELANVDLEVFIKKMYD